VPGAAIVLTGGAARRLCGVDKCHLDVGGRRVVSRIVTAVREAGASPVLLVGPDRGEPRATAVREQPPGGGPVAGLGAGVDALGALGAPAATLVWLLAGDLPFVTTSALEELRRRVIDGAAAVDGAVAVDGAGRDQPLLSVWRLGALRAALPAEPSGARLRDVLTRLTAARVPLEGDPPPWWDIDTPEQLAQARALAGDTVAAVPPVDVQAVAAGRERAVGDPE